MSMNFDDFLNKEVKRVKAPKKKAENKPLSTTPIEDVQRRFKEIRSKYGYIDLRKKD